MPASKGRKHRRDVSLRKIFVGLANARRFQFLQSLGGGALGRPLRHPLGDELAVVTTGLVVLEARIRVPVVVSHQPGPPREHRIADGVGRFRRDGSCHRFFFVCHSAAGPLSCPAEPGLHLWTAERVADAALDAGLFNWLVERTQ
jgi:hypothetical protein